MLSGLPGVSRPMMASAWPTVRTRNPSGFSSSADSPRVSVNSLWPTKIGFFPGGSLPAMGNLRRKPWRYRSAIRGRRISASPARRDRRRSRSRFFPDPPARAGRRLPVATPPRRRAPAQRVRNPRRSRSARSCWWRSMIASRGLGGDINTDICERHSRGGGTCLASGRSRRPPAPSSHIVTAGT